MTVKMYEESRELYLKLAMMADINMPWREYDRIALVRDRSLRRQERRFYKLHTEYKKGN